jgi:hypothetical protein
VKPALREKRGGHSRGELAQLGERLLCTQEVTGSIPVFSTNCERGAEPFRTGTVQLGTRRGSLSAVARQGEGGEAACFEVL